MSKTPNSLIPGQNRIVKWLFVETADDNYVAARWCSIKRLNVDFFWLASQALEKYMKAVLLLNGCSSKGYGHDLIKLHNRVSQFDLTLLPTKLTKPSGLEIPHWRDELTTAFLERLAKMGSPDNRYQIFGYEKEREDLCKVDQMAFAIRRLCCPLGDQMFGKEIPAANGSTYRDFLKRQPELQPHWATSRMARIFKGEDRDLHKDLGQVT